MAGKKSSSERKPISKKKTTVKNGATATATEKNGDMPVMVVQTEVIEISEIEVRQRAYELYEARGRQDGFDWDDWIRAETEVRTRQKVGA